MKITLFLLIVGIGIAYAKYIPHDAGDLKSSGVSRWESNESVPSEERDNSNDNDSSSDDGDSREEKLRKKLLEHQEKVRVRQEERQRKLEEKRIKEEHKEQEKREKEERKRLERLEKEHQKQEKAQRKAEENLRKAERKQQKELNELRNDAIQESAEDFLDTEEESSVEAADVWRNHIYVKYGLTHASSRLEKHAAISKYMKEELGLTSNSTNSERRQAILNLIKTKLSSDPVIRKAIGEQLVSHLSSAGVHKMQAGLVEDIEELDNKTRLLNNINLPWAEQAKVEIQDKRRFLFAMSQFLSNILQPQNPNKEATNGPNGVSSTAPDANSLSSDNISATLSGGNSNNSPSTTSASDNVNNLSSNQAPNAVSPDNAGSPTQTIVNEASQGQSNTVIQNIPSIDNAGQAAQTVASAQNNIVNNEVVASDALGGPSQTVDSKPLLTEGSTINQDASLTDNASQSNQATASGIPSVQNNVNDQVTTSDISGGSVQTVVSETSQKQGSTINQDSSLIDNASQSNQAAASGISSVQNNVNDAVATSNISGGSTQIIENEVSQTQGGTINQDASVTDNASQQNQAAVSETSSVQNNVNNQVATTDISGGSTQTVGGETSLPQGSTNSQDASVINNGNDAVNQEASADSAGGTTQSGVSEVATSEISSDPTVGSETLQSQGSTNNPDASVTNNAVNGINQEASADIAGGSTQTGVNDIVQIEQSQGSTQDVSSTGLPNQEVASADNVDTVSTQSAIQNDSVNGETQTGSGDGPIPPSQSISLNDTPKNQDKIENNVVTNGASQVVVDPSVIPAENPNVGQEITENTPVTDSSLLPVETQTSSNNDASQAIPVETATENVDNITTDEAALLNSNTLDIATTESTQLNNAENNTSITTEAPNSGDTVNPIGNVNGNQDNTESSTTNADGGLAQETQTEATSGLIPVQNANEIIENTTNAIVETTEAQAIADITTEATQETVTDGITVPVEPGASIVEITQQ